MKKALIILSSIIFLLVVGILFYLKKDTTKPYVKLCDYTVPESEIPTFKEVSLDFEHHYDGKNELPIVASCMIDIDNDGVDEIYIGGGAKQSDGLFKFKGDRFENIADQVNLNDTHERAVLGAASFDIDEDGFTDILIGRADGVYLLKNLEGKFTTIKLDIQLDEKSNPGAPTFGDFDRDGDADIFISTYIKKELAEGYTIFNKKDYGSNSILLRNDGNLKFTDVTEEMNIKYTHNTFQGMFVDIDNDNWLDLMVVYDTGESRAYKNEQGKTFKLMTTPMSGKFGYPMGLATGDYNNDGNQDFFFSNTGTTVPKFMLKGDLTDEQTLITDWILFENQGNFKFKDVAQETKVADYEFSWGAIFEDFNLDGRQDLVVAENYVSFPGHKVFKLPCRFLIQRADGTFSPVEEQAKVVNKNYAITPLSSDFNQDGYPDLIYINLDGNQKAFINNGGDKKSIKVKFAETAANVGAKVTVELNDSLSILSDMYLIGEGLSSDMSNVLVFGLGNEDQAAKLTIEYINGEKEIIENPQSGITYIAGKTM